MHATDIWRSCESCSRPGGGAIALTTVRFGERCLYASAREGHLEIVQALLSSHPGLLMLNTDRGNSCLDAAVTHRATLDFVVHVLQIVTQMLLEVGVDVMMLRDVQGDNCICLAFKRGHTGGNSGTGCGTRGVGASVQSDS